MRELRRLGHKTIMINYNPETVSTDYDECDRLYFDQLTFETVMDIYELESARGIVLSMGGQIPNNISGALQRAKARILGTAPEMIDSAENRYKFSRMCDSIGVDQPKWKELSSLEAALQFADEVGYPCLMRPSYILSGTAMRVAHSASDLANDFKAAVVVSRDYPVVLTKFILDAKEIEIDAVASQGELVAFCISEHVENAGVHSGDATIVHPPQDLTQKTMDGCTEIAAKIARALHITGPFNIQFIAKEDHLKVIECNVRASRSFPFVSKTANIDMIAIATRVMIGADPDVPPRSVIKHVGVKVPQFSFNRLAGADPTLGVDMISTGEVACFGHTREEAYVKAMVATSFIPPPKGGNILLSIGGYEGKQEFLPSVRRLETLGYKLYGSMGTADFYLSHNVKVTPVDWLADSEEVVSIKDTLVEGHYDLVVNLPMRNKYRRPASYTTSGSLTRLMAVEQKVPLITNIKCAKLFVQALATIDITPRASSVDCQSSLSYSSLPGFVDMHAEVSSLDSTDIQELTSAALEGGFTGLGVLVPAAAVPHTAEDVDHLCAVVEQNAACDVGLIFSVPQDLTVLPVLARRAVAISVDLIHTHKSMSMAQLRTVFAAWSSDRPIVVQAEGFQLGSCLLFASMFRRSVHVAHVRAQEDICLISAARAQGALVTCSTAIPSLFKFSNDRVPEAVTEDNRQALWEHIDEIDVLTSGHGQVSGSAKLSTLRTCLPMLLSAVDDQRLTLEDLRLKLHDNPLRIFGLRRKDSLYNVEVVLSDSWTSADADLFDPFLNAKMRGRVARVVVGGALGMIDGKKVPDGSKGVVMKASSIPAQPFGERTSLAPLMQRHSETDATVDASALAERERERERTISESSIIGRELRASSPTRPHLERPSSLAVAAKTAPGTGWLRSSSMSVGLACCRFGMAFVLGGWPFAHVSFFFYLSSQLALATRCLAVPWHSRVPIASGVPISFPSAKYVCAQNRLQHLTLFLFWGGAVWRLQ